MATFAQLELIRCPWRAYTRGAAGKDELNTWLLNKFRLSSLRFVDMKAPRKMITALKAMKVIEMIAARGEDPVHRRPVAVYRSNSLERVQKCPSSVFWGMGGGNGMAGLCRPFFLMPATAPRYVPAPDRVTGRHRTR